MEARGVVHLVGDTCGEGADRREAVALHELLLEPHPLCNVAGEAQHRGLAVVLKGE